MRILDGSVARTFILAGSARVTLVSQKTNARYTYLVRISKRNDGDTRPPVHFVSILTGPDNEECFQFLGTIFSDGMYRKSPNTNIGPRSPSALAFDYAWRYLTANEIPPFVEVWHEGRCGRCGRTLTVPESIEIGLGPVCAQYDS